MEDAREGAVGGNAVGEFESFAQAVFTQLGESSLKFVGSHAAERGRKGDEDATTARWRRDASDELGRHCASNQLAQIPDEVTTHLTRNLQFRSMRGSYWPERQFK